MLMRALQLMTPKHIQPVVIYYKCLVNIPTIAWVSRRQTKIALSTMTAEYYALCEITREIIWLRQLLESLGLNIQTPTIIYEDNASCIAIAKNPTNHKGTRELNIKLFFIRDETENSLLLRASISSSNNIADILTKSLPTKRFHDLLTQIGLKL